MDMLNNQMWGGVYWTRQLEKRMENSLCLESFGYKVYSQNDEDGITHEIFNRIGTKSKKFVEFGVDKGIECNSHSLLLQGWSGLWIEGNTEAYNQVIRRFAPAIRMRQLCVRNQYVLRDNIDEIINDFCPDGELDLLSIDIDGNDYHIWKAIESVKARVVIIEYNGKFTPEIFYVMPYNKDHIWDRTDRCGASLKALEKLGVEKGYQLVGTNISGINAFFVRADLTNDMFYQPATAEKLYNPARMNILRHLNGHQSRNYVGTDIEGMEGVFEYYPDWNYIPVFGFGAPKARCGEDPVCEMVGNTGRICVRNRNRSDHIIVVCDNANDERYRGKVRVILAGNVSEGTEIYDGRFDIKLIKNEVTEYQMVELICEEKGLVISSVRFA